MTLDDGAGLLADGPEADTTCGTRHSCGNAPMRDRRAPDAFDTWQANQLRMELTMRHLEQAPGGQGGSPVHRSAVQEDRRSLVIRLAPPAPPCFSDRLAWLEYLAEMQASLKGGERGPLDMRAGVPKFNHGLDFCADCSARHALAMQRESRCKPDHLLDLATETALS